MGQYTLKIDTFTLLVTPEYSPQIDYLWKEDGSQVAAREKWPLRCWLVADNPSLRSQWNAFLALVETGHPKDVRFLLDGAPVDDLLVSRHNNSPRFENIHTVMAGGAFVNHVEFTMDVVADRAVKFDGIIDVDEVEDVTSGPEGVRRNVRIKAVGNNARPFVLERLSHFEGIPLNIVRRTDTFGNSLEITATYDITKESSSVEGGGGPRSDDDELKSVRRLTEKFSYRPGLRPIREYPLASFGETAAFLVKGGFRAGRLACSGHIEASSDNTAAPGEFRLFRIINPAAKPFLPYIEDVQVDGPYVSEWANVGQPATWSMDYSWAAVFPEIGKVSIGAPGVEGSNDFSGDPQINPRTARAFV